MQRTVVITGCSDNSLGSHLALSFHKTGFKVFATTRDPSKATQTQAAGIDTLPLDVSSESSISTCASHISKLTGGSLDILVNNAGIGYYMPLLDMDLDRTRQDFEVNTLSLISVTKAFFPLLRESKYTAGALVVNNTSCMGVPHVSMPFSGGYSISKAAAVKTSELMRMELSPFNIRVTNLLTGSVKSAFFTKGEKPQLPEDSVYAVAREAVEYSMSGDEVVRVGADPVQWADTIVKQVSKETPALWIWKGTNASKAWLGTFLPTGALDAMVKKMSGVDAVAKNLNNTKA